MDNLKKIEKLLDTYIKQNKLIVNEYEKNKLKKATYEELIELLNEDYDKLLNNKNLIIAFLNSLYDDDLYCEEFEYLISQSKPNLTEIKDLISIIIQDYEILSKELQSLELRIKEEEILELSAKRVRNNLKYHKLIDEKGNDIKNTIEILSNLKNRGTITNQESILLINEILYYNELKEVEKGNPNDIEYTQTAYNEIPNILTSGFQEHDVVEVSHNIKNKLDKQVNEILELIKNQKEEKIIMILKLYKKDIKDNNYNYIIVEILNTYLEELLTIYMILLDEKTITNRKQRREIIKNYYEVLNKYLTIYNYYNEITEYSIDSNEKIIVDSEQEKRLIYSRSEINITKEKIISDMSDVPYEYYETVYDLLTRFKKGTLSPNEMTVLHNHKEFNGHLELRYDQVRIIIKHIKDNIYNVLGVFAKKDDKDLPMYRTITNRITPDVSTDKLLSHQLELSTITENKLEKLVQEKGRKGTR